MLLALTSVGLRAQKYIPVSTSEIVIGHDYIHGKDIKATEYLFPEKIISSYIDTATSYLTLQMRGVTKSGKWIDASGDIVLYDIAYKMIRWTLDVNYNQGGIDQYNDLIIKSNGYKNYCIDIKTGANKWEVKDNIYFVNPGLNVALGYKVRMGSDYTNTLEGIDLATGKSLWSREIDREFGWNRIIPLSSYEIGIVAKGFHTINLLTGEGWDYNTLTGRRNYAGTVITNVLGLAAGLMTGTYFFATGHNVISDFVSNPVIDSASIYLASREQIARLNRNGKIQWILKLPDDKISKSSIFRRDSVLYLINKGYAFNGLKKIDFGSPFFSAYSVNDGRQLYFNNLGDKKTNINSYTTRGDTVYFLYKDKISKLSLATGSVLLEYPFNAQVTGEPEDFVGPQVFEKSDSVFKSLVLSDSSKLFVYTNKGKLLVLNQYLETVNISGIDQYYIAYRKTPGYIFLHKGNETVVIDTNNKMVAEFKASGKAKLLGNKLYDVQEKSFIEIDLSVLFGGQ